MTADESTKRPVVRGQMARAEMCGCGGSVVLSVGAVTLRLELPLVEDVVATLQQMLALTTGMPRRPCAGDGDRQEWASDDETRGDN
jgi:hypothetical protein